MFLGLKLSLTARLRGSTSVPVTPGDALLMEGGDYLLLESGDKILLEA